MASYQISRNMTVQANINNIFDKQYLTRVRTRRLAWATPGEARSVVVSASMRF
jgi:catecholate siderophore receptor